MPITVPDLVVSSPPFHLFRQPEIGDVRLAGDINENLARLEVAMEDAALVGVVDGSGHLLQEPRRLGRRALRRGGGGAVDELHGEILLPLVFANFVDGDDVGMVEPGRGMPPRPISSSRRSSPT